MPSQEANDQQCYLSAKVFHMTPQWYLKCEQQANRLEDGEQVWYDSRGEVEIETSMFLGPNDHLSEHLNARKSSHANLLRSCPEDSLRPAGDSSTAL